MRVAKAEKDSADQRKSEEDAEDGGGSEGYLAILSGLLVKILQVMIGLISGLHS